MYAIEFIILGSYSKDIFNVIIFITYILYFIDQINIKWILKVRQGL
jgi:hypothetical protein